MMADFAHWYCREDYERIRQIMNDGGELPKTFDAWERGAKRSLSHAKENGFIFQQIRLDPNEFVAFCEEKKIPHDSRARASFARERGLARERDAHIARTIAWEERARGLSRG